LPVVHDQSLDPASASGNVDERLLILMINFGELEATYHQSRCGLESRREKDERERERERGRLEDSFARVCNAGFLVSGLSRRTVIRRVDVV